MSKFFKDMIGESFIGKLAKMLHQWLFSFTCPYCNRGKVKANHYDEEVEELAYICENCGRRFTHQEVYKYLDEEE